MAIDSSVIAHNLSILAKIVSKVHIYSALTTKLIDAKQVYGSKFKVCYSKNSIAMLLLSLDELKIPLQQLPRDGSVQIPAYEVLKQLTHDFNILTGLSKEEYCELVTYVYLTSKRSWFSRDYLTQNITINSLSSHDNEIVDVMLEHPWILTMILLEQIDVVR